jgi:hypothetical protein
MKDLLAKLLSMFHKPEPTKPVEPVEAWPFPVKTETAKKQVKKATTRKPKVKESPLIKTMKAEQKEVKKALKSKAKK